MIFFGCPFDLVEPASIESKFELQQSQRRERCQMWWECTILRSAFAAHCCKPSKTVECSRGFQGQTWFPQSHQKDIWLFRGASTRRFWCFGFSHASKMWWTGWRQEKSENSGIIARWLRDKATTSWRIQGRSSTPIALENEIGTLALLTETWKNGNSKTYLRDRNLRTFLADDLYEFDWSTNYADHGVHLKKYSKADPSARIDKFLVRIDV